MPHSIQSHVSNNISPLLPTIGDLCSNFEGSNGYPIDVDIELESGDIIVMGGEIQTHWKHGIKKTSKIKEPRYNFTFRRIDHE